MVSHILRFEGQQKFSVAIPFLFLNWLEMSVNCLLDETLCYQMILTRSNIIFSVIMICVNWIKPNNLSFKIPKDPKDPKDTQIHSTN